MVDAMRYVGMFTRDLDRARAFFVKTLGFKTRAVGRRRGYLAVGIRERGPEACLAIFEPRRDIWGDEYEDALDHIGEPVMSFRAANVSALSERLRQRGVTARLFETRGNLWVRFEDPDGNSFVAHEDPWAHTRRPAFTAMDHVSVVTRDEARAGAFFTNGLGMEPSALPGWGFVEYRLTPGSTAIVPFTPTPDMYEGWTDPGKYEEDLARVGETTYVVFAAGDLRSLRRRSSKIGFQVTPRPDHPVWGGPMAEFKDPDGNAYWVVERKRRREP